jgi:hypothetical protein
MPDGAKRLKATLARRLYRLSPEIDTLDRLDTLDRHVTITNEAPLPFIHFWMKPLHGTRLGFSPYAVKPAQKDELICRRGKPVGTKRI